MPDPDRHRVRRWPQRPEDWIIGFGRTAQIAADLGLREPESAAQVAGGTSWSPEQQALRNKYPRRW